MNGRRLVLVFLGFLLLFVAALVWFQFFAFYERHHDVVALPVPGKSIAISDYDGIDATSSPLKLRGCFRIDPVSVVSLPVAPDATPLVAPFWFGCFDARALTRDIAAGKATAHLVARDTPDGFDMMIAVYPDGRGYLWRQLNARFE